MLPDIDLRIQNMIKAMKEVVAPALPPSERLAMDQAMLVIGQLNLLQSQWKYAPQFERGSLDALTSLGERLLKEAHGDITPKQAQALSHALKAAANCSMAIDDLVVHINSVGAAIDKIILNDDSATPIPASITRAVLDYGQHQAHRERTWFQGNNLDPDRGKLPSLESLFS